MSTDRHDPHSIGASGEVQEQSYPLRSSVRRAPDGHALLAPRRFASDARFGRVRPAPDADVRPNRIGVLALLVWAAVVYASYLAGLR